MVANPIPDYHIAFEKTENPIVVAHTYRINRFFVVYPLEMQTWVVRVHLPHLIGLSCASLHTTRKARIELPELSSSL